MYGCPESFQQLTQKPAVPFPPCIGAVPQAEGSAGACV